MEEKFNSQSSISLAVDDFVENDQAKRLDAAAALIERVLYDKVHGQLTREFEQKYQRLL